jgi:hypothetical protein
MKGKIMSVNYEVASEVLAAESGFLIQALVAEEKKSKPSPLLIKYYEDRIQAVTALEKKFRSDDDGITDNILEQRRIFGCRGND